MEICEQAYVATQAGQRNSKILLYCIIVTT